MRPPHRSPSSSQAQDIALSRQRRGFESRWGRTVRVDQLPPESLLRKSQESLESARGFRFLSWSRAVGVFSFDDSLESAQQSCEESSLTWTAGEESASCSDLDVRPKKLTHLTFCDSRLCRIEERTTPSSTAGRVWLSALQKQQKTVKRHFERTGLQRTERPFAAAQYVVSRARSQRKPTRQLECGRFRCHCRSIPRKMPSVSLHSRQLARSTGPER